MCIVFYFTSKKNSKNLFVPFFSNLRLYMKDALNMGEVLGQQDNDIDN